MYPLTLRELTISADPGTILFPLTVVQLLRKRKELKVADSDSCAHGGLKGHCQEASDTGAFNAHGFDQGAKSLVTGTTLSLDRSYYGNFSNKAEKFTF